MDVSRLLFDDNLQTLKKGRRFYRIFNQQNGPTAYSDNTVEHPWRFTPFELPHIDDLIQGLYMADSPMSCLQETIFRKGHSGVLTLNCVEQRMCIALDLTADLQVYLMTGQLLEATLGFDPVQQNDYPVCRELAKILLSKFPQLQGIVYQSFQTDARTLNLVVFSHSTGAGNFKPVRSSRAFVLSEYYRADLLAAASSSGQQLSGAVRDYCLGHKII